MPSIICYLAPIARFPFYCRLQLPLLLISLLVPSLLLALDSSWLQKGHCLLKRCIPVPHALPIIHHPSHCASHCCVPFFPFILLYLAPSPALVHPPNFCPFVVPPNCGHHPLLNLTHTPLLGTSPVGAGLVQLLWTC